MIGYLKFILLNRRFLAFGITLTFFSSFGQTTFIGLFGSDLRAEFDLSHGGFGLVYALATVASGGALIWLGRYIDHLDLRLYSLLVCLGMVASAFLLATAPSVWMFGLALFALRLACQGLMVHTAITAMARYFSDGRGKAVSLASTGNTIGQGIFPVMAVAAAGAIGWRTTWMALATACAIVLVPLVLWLLKGHAARHRRYLAQLDAGAAEAAVNGPRPRRQWTRAEVLRDPRFYLILPVALASPFITTGLFFHAAALAEAKSWDMTYLAGMYLPYAAVTVVASLLSGSLIDRYGAVRLLPWFLWPLATALLLLAASAHPAIAAAYLMLLGLTSGAAHAISGALWAELYGSGHLGAIRALTVALMVFSTAAAPIAFGALLDLGVAIESIGLLCLGLIGLASLLAARPMVRGPVYEVA